MRGVLIALPTIAFVHGAAAADYGGGPLRGTSVYELGPPREPRWNGFYFGGQWSYASPSADFHNATAGMVAHLLRETTIENQGQVSAWTTLGKASTSVSGFGGFFGYN